MRFHPSREEFVELAKGHDLVPVYRQLLGDTLTPVTAFSSIQESDWSFLFESVVGGEILGATASWDRVRFSSSRPGTSMSASKIPPPGW